MADNYFPVWTQLNKLTDTETEATTALYNSVWQLKKTTTKNMSSGFEHSQTFSVVDKLMCSEINLFSWCVITSGFTLAKNFLSHETSAWQI